MARPRIVLDRHAVTKAYDAGHTMTAIATALGVDRSIVRRTLTEAGRIIEPRSGRTPAECGTDSGYYRHLRGTKTVPCDPCLDAHSAATAVRAGRPATVPCVSCGTSTTSGRCRGCAPRRRPQPDLTYVKDIAFTGTWRPVRGVLRPVQGEAA